MVQTVRHGEQRKAVVRRCLIPAHGAGGLVLSAVFVRRPRLIAVLARHRRAAELARAGVARGGSVGVPDLVLVALGDGERITEVCDLVALLVHYLHGRADTADGQSVFIRRRNTTHGDQRTRAVLLQIDVQRRLFKGAIHFKYIHRQRRAVAEDKIDGRSTDSQRAIDGRVPRHHVPFIAQNIIIVGQFRGVRADLLRTALADILHRARSRHDLRRPLYALVVFADRERAAAFIRVLVAGGKHFIYLSVTRAAPNAVPIGCAGRKLTAGQHRSITKSNVQSVGGRAVELTAGDIHHAVCRNHARLAARKRTSIKVRFRFTAVAGHTDRTAHIPLPEIGVAVCFGGFQRTAVHSKRAFYQRHHRVVVGLHDLAAGGTVHNGQVAAIHAEHSVIPEGVVAIIHDVDALGHCFAVQIQRDIAACQYDALVIGGAIQRQVLQHRHRAAGGIRRCLERLRQRGILHAVVLGLVLAGGQHGDAVLPALHRRVLPHRVGGAGHVLLRFTLRRDQLGPRRRGQHAERHHKAHEQTDDPSLHLSSSPSISFQVFHC